MAASKAQTAGCDKKSCGDCRTVGSSTPDVRMALVEELRAAFSDFLPNDGVCLDCCRKKTRFEAYESGLC